MQSPSTCNQFQLEQTFPACQADHGAVRKPAIQRLGEKIIKRILTPAWHTEHDATGPKLVSRYDADEYGRPRPLSPLEITIHSVAKPILIGLIIVFGLVVSVLVLCHTWSAAPEKITRSAHISPEAHS